MYLRKLNRQYDINRLLPLLDQVEWDSHGRAAINEPTGHWLYDSYKIKDQWQGTEFERLAEEMPVVVSEIRLMKLEAGAVYRSHADIDDRVHLNLQSNEQCYLIDLDNQNMYPVVADNELYIMDGSYLHTAVNFGSTPRVQLVMRIPLERHRNSEFKSFYIDKPAGSPGTIEVLIELKSIDRSAFYDFLQKTCHTMGLALRKHDQP